MIYVDRYAVCTPHLDRYACSIFHRGCFACREVDQIPSRCRYDPRRPLRAERIVMLSSSSASKKWREDVAMIVLCGSMAEYSASPQTWRSEPSASLSRRLTGDAFAELSDAATRFVHQH
jgi:hypothetical protein